VIISGDSDFSPLVSKLRENNKVVIGVGVKNSTSDLLIANCDEFIFYDDLVREQKKAESRKAGARKAAGAGGAKKKGGEALPGHAEARDSSAPQVARAETKQADAGRQQEAIDIIVSTVEALVSERGGDDKIWGSMVKQAVKRVRPGFNESYYGFRSFNGMLEAAEQAGSLRLERDEKSGGYIVRLAAHEE
jgi:hypothetical protein